MTRLPTPGGDAGNWGSILNEYLSAVHNTDGSLKTGVVAGSNLASGSITTDKLADAAITPAKLASSVQTTLSSVVTTSTVGAAGGIASLDSSGKVPASQLPEASGGTTPAATASVSGTIRLTGDLGGSATSPSVVKLNGVSLTGTPSAGQALVATSSTAAGWQVVSGGLAPGSTLWSTDSDPATTTATQASVEDGDMWVDRTTDASNVSLKIRSNSQWVTFATKPKPINQNPTNDAPSSPVATTTSTSITLAWTAPSNPSGAVEGYNVYNISNGTSSKLNSTLINTTNYAIDSTNLPGIQPNTQYSFDIKTVIAGQEKSSINVTASTKASATNPGTTTGLIFPANQTVKIMPVGDSITHGFAGSSAAQQGLTNNILGAGYRQLLWKDIVENTSWKTETVGRMSDAEPLVSHPNFTVGSHVDAQHARHSGFGGWDALDFHTTCPNSNHARTSSSQYFNSAFGGISDWINDYSPDIILLEIGTNDINQWIAPTAAEVHENIKNLITHIYSVDPNMILFVSTIPPIPPAAYNPGDIRIEEAPKINPGIPGVVKPFRDSGKKIYFADICSQLTNSEMHDVHPNDAGYAKMAANWRIALEKADKGEL